MKKKLIVSGAAMALLAVIICMSVSKEDSELSLLSQNVEALAWGENSNGDKTLDIHSTVGYCFVWMGNKMYRGGGSPQCQSGSRFTVCPDCYNPEPYN